MRSLTRFAALLLAISFVASAPQPLGAVTTDTFRDEFNSVSYSGDDGTQSWADGWWDSEDQDPLAGGIKVDSDAAVDFILWFATDGSGQYVERTADLSVYDTATLSFDYRRRNTDPSFSLKVQASANGPAGPFTEILAITGGNDAAYVGSGDIPITAHKSATTTIRFLYETSTGPGKDFYVDNVEISAIAANLPPVAANDSGSTDIDIPVTIDVLANDSDPDLDVLSVDSVTQGANGTVANNGTDVTYTPNSGWRGVDTFTYTATDGNGGFDTASITVGVGGVCYVVGETGGADALAQVNLGSGLETLVGATGTSGITAAALHPLTGTLYASLPGQLGTLDLVTGVFTPTTGPVGGSFDNIQAIAFDTDGSLYAFHHRAGPKDLLIRVDPSTGAFIPDAFGPGVDSVSLDSSWPTQKSVAGIDINGFGQMYGVTSNDGPNYTIQWIDKTSGSAFVAWAASVTADVSLDATGRLWMLSPTGTLSEPFGSSIGLSGLTGYQAVACEGGLPNQSPSATGDTDTTAEDTAVTVDVLANDADGDLDPLVVDAATDGLNGSVANNGTDVTYTPDPDWSGIDTFSYSVSDGNGGFASAQVTVTVSAVPDPPVAVDDVGNTLEDIAVTVGVLVNDSDVDLDVLVVDSVTQGVNGSVVNNGTDVTYVPNPVWFGVDSFTYTVTDGNGGFDTATVTVDVGAVNDNPVATDDVPTTPRDTAVYIWVLDNDTDVDPDTLTVSGFTNGANGSVVNNTIKVTYTPDPGWTGTDTFTYTVSDGNGGFDTATVTVTVTAGPNRPPVAEDDTKTIDEDTPATIAVLANDSDPDGDAVTVSAVNQGAHGSVTKAATSVTYTPDQNWTGVDSFSYSISDGGGGTATAAVVITVKAVNDPPTAKDDSTSTPASTDVKIAVLANDSDVDGDPLTVATITQGSHGVTTTDGSTIRYSPSPGWSGTDSFTYTITDGHGGSDSATVVVSVGNVNRPPTISVTGDTSVAEDDRLALEISVVDPDGDRVDISANGLPDWAVMVDHGDGRATISGTPGFDADPSSEITISASDGMVTARITTTIDIIDVDRAPLIRPITFSGVNDDGSFSFAIAASDPDGDPLSISASGLPAWATLTDHGDGTATISSGGVPDDAVGSFSVIVSVTDGESTVTSSLSRSIADLRLGLPPELTHQAFGTDGGENLVATALKPRVGTPDPLGVHLTPREGLLVAFGSAVETMKNQVIPAVILGVVMAWMLMIGVGRVKEEEEPEAA